MLRLSGIPLSLLLLMLASPGVAQDGSFDDQTATTASHIPAVTSARSPEVWIYEQERIRYEDPKTAIRQRAELRAAQRAGRIASMKWYGMSNSRPRAFCTPSMSSYSPYWGSNTYDPNRWRPYSTPSVVVRPTEGPY
jgi:hypothetical protein